MWWAEARRKVGQFALRLLTIHQVAEFDQHRWIPHLAFDLRDYQTAAESDL
jgi:hypothetical protein